MSFAASFKCEGFAVKLLLVFLLGMVVLGLVTDRLDRRTYAIVAGSATVMTGLFFGFERFWS